MDNKKTIIEEFNQMANYIYDKISSLSKIKIDDLDLENTLLVIIDMNNGFARGGALYSNRVENLINPIADFANKLRQKNVDIIAFTDYHKEDSIEFLNYPNHCIEGTKECEIVDKINNIEGIKVINKNSTNGFFSTDFHLPAEKKNFIVVGNCTDICIYQFVITLKAYFNEFNSKKNIFVPLNLVETFHIETHKANFMNLVFLNSMIDNGIIVGPVE